MLEATGAQRVSVFELVDGEVLRLWAASSRTPRQEMWDAGLALGGIPLDEIPSGHELLAFGEPR